MAKDRTITTFVDKLSNTISDQISKSRKTIINTLLDSVYDNKSFNRNEVAEYKKYGEDFLKTTKETNKNLKKFNTKMIGTFAEKLNTGLDAVVDKVSGDSHTKKSLKKLNKVICNYIKDLGTEMAKSFSKSVKEGVKYLRDILDVMAKVATIILDNVCNLWTKKETKEKTVDNIANGINKRVDNFEKIYSKDKDKAVSESIKKSVGSNTSKLNKSRKEKSNSLSL